MAHKGKIYDVDWTAIKAEYCSGVQIKKLSEKYKIPYGYLKQRAYKGRWSATKHQNSEKIVSDFSQKYAENLVQVQLDTKRRMMSIWDVQLAKLLKRLDGRKKIQHGEYAQLVRCIEVIQRGMFECLDIQTGKQQYPGGMDVLPPVEQKFREAVAQIPIEEIIIYARRRLGIE